MEKEPLRPSICSMRCPASLLGSLLGVIIGMQFFPKVIFDAYNSIYNVPTLYTPMYADLASMSIAMAVGTTFLATLWASLSSLSHKPSDLMRPKAPKIGQAHFARARAFPLETHELFRQGNGAQPVSLQKTAVHDGAGHCRLPRRCCS